MMQIRRQLRLKVVEVASFRPRLDHTLMALGTVVVSFGSALAPVSAQFPPCPPPAANEYLLLVRSDTEPERNRIQDLLPSNSTVMVCNYLEDAVVRAGGFTNLENANAWAQYMTEVEGFQAFVARPAAGSQPVNNPANNTPANGTSPATNPADTTTAANNQSNGSAQTSAANFAPQPLGDGFAVLVDYQNDPDRAVAIQEQVGQAVGLAVHKQRAYLLIAYSPDIDGAASTMNVLSGYGISGFIVDSNEVVMLTPAIALGN